MWDEQQADNVRGLLTQFNGAEEVCAVMGCEESQLDGLCLAAFSMDFATAKSTLSAQGRAMVRRTLMQQALDGNMEALDMLAREQLGMGAVETRRRFTLDTGNRCPVVKVERLHMVENEVAGTREEAVA